MDHRAIDVGWEKSCRTFAYLTFPTAVATFNWNNTAIQVGRVGVGYKF